MIYLLLGALILNNVLCSICYKRTNRSAAVTLFSDAVWGVIIFIFAFCISFAFYENVFVGVNTKIVFLICLHALSMVFCVLTWALSVKHVHMSIAEVISMSRMLFLLVLSWLIFNDTVRVVGICLVVLIFVSCAVLGLLQFNTENKQNLGKRYIFGVSFLGAWVLFATISGLLMKEINISPILPTTYCLIVGLAFFAISLPVLLLSRQKFRQSIRACFCDKAQIGIGITDNIWMFFYIPLAIFMNLGVLEAMLQISTVLVVLWGVIIMREKISLWAYPLIIIVIVASVILSFFG
jgi:drug/metabolite transporter (DMT)-like permease